MSFILKLSHRVMQNPVAPHCAPIEAFNSSVNLKCDPIINLYFPDGAEHIDFLQHLCKLAFVLHEALKVTLQ